MDENDVFGEDPNLFSEGMLENGFYPENLPPVFTVTNFHEAAIPHLKSDNYLSKKTTEPATYNSSKRGGARRTFEMPNPIFMVDSARFFSKYRTEISEHFSSTDDSLSVPKFQQEGRPARITSHSDFHRLRRQKLATSRFIVRTDISRYFHSIYTHSIPWALHGKVDAKKDRKPESMEIYGNRLDHIIRQAQDGQTVGIPVGPDFSRYTSEIVGKAIDAKFRHSHGDQCPMIRHVDDVYIGADDQDEANQLLTGVRDAIRQFQLDVNDSKTSIVPTNLDLEPFWPVRIRREIEGFSGSNPKSTGNSTGHDFVYFLDEVVRIANEQKDDGVVKYALRKMDDLKIWENYWHLVEPFLVRAAINFPHCWDYIARIVSWRFRTEGLQTKLWGQVVSKSLTTQSKAGNDSETCWALWLAKEANLPIDLHIHEAILERCGALAATLAIDVYQSNPQKFSYPKAKLLERIGDRPMIGENWLLAYEADRLFGFKLKTKILNGPHFFEELYDNDTEFYDPDGIPTAFENIDDPSEVEAALEDVNSYYDDDYDDTDWEEEVPDENF